MKEGSNMRTLATSLAALSLTLAGGVLSAQAEEVTASKSTGLILMDEEE